jgi:hypothetical protein
MNWMLLLIGTAFMASLLFLAVCAVIGLVRLARAWQREPAHACPGPEAAEPWPPPVFGSMDLEADREYWKSAGQPLTPGGYLRGLDAIMGQTATTNLNREPDDPYDPADDPPWTWREQTAADLDPLTLAVAHEDDALYLGWNAELPPKPEGDMSQRPASGPEGEAYSRGVLPSGPRPDQSGSVTGTKLPSQPEPVMTPAGRLVESSDEWMRRLKSNAAPGWTFAGELVAA